MSPETVVNIRSSSNWTEFFVKVYKCKKCGMRFWNIICFENNVGKFHGQLVHKTGLYSLLKVFKSKKLWKMVWRIFTLKIRLEIFIKNS